MNEAQQIMDNLNIKDALEYYGIHFNRRGYAVCPFHKEKTASFKTYNNRFKCFGCGESGSIIDFVMRAYGLDFKQAIVRIDHDFQLGIIDRKPSRKERLQMAENKRIQAAKGRFEELLHQNYLRACRLHETLYRQLIAGNNTPGLEEYINTLSGALDDFTGQETRTWPMI